MPRLLKWQYFRYIFLFLALIGGNSCGHPAKQEPFVDCRYGAPEPIFNPALASVSRHSFHIEKDKAVEELAFSDGLELTIFQTGCEFIRQEFRFRWEGNFQGAPDDFWIGEAARVFNRLGQLGPEYLVYRNLAQTITENGGRMRLDESIKLQDGFYFQAKTILSADETNLSIIISEQP